jgi:general stress protein 26
LYSFAFCIREYENFRFIEKIMTATSNENEKDLEKLFGIIGHVKFAMLTTVNEDGTLHSR